MKYAYWLSANLTNEKIHHLRSLNLSAEEVWNLPEAQLKTIPGITVRDQEKILNSRTKWNPEEEWMCLQEKGIGFTFLDQSDYPLKLRTVCNAPYGLYYIGKLPDQDKLQVAVVGARMRSAYGCTIAEELGKALGKGGIEVISGLAMGVDADGHKGCLDGGGTTYAVLGCGVDICYPKQNRWIYEKIRNQGGIISEYPPGTPPIARRFPARNRIISGLSDKIVIVEAREKSGSLITADFAMEQGRDVYAVPGRISDTLSQGCNRLIRQGAGMFVSIEDFLEELNINTGRICTQLDFRSELLEGEEKLIYNLLDIHPTNLGLLIEKTGLPMERVLENISSMREKGFIREYLPNYFVKNI